MENISNSAEPVLAGIENLRSLLESALISGLILAVVVVVVMQLWKTWLRSSFHKKRLSQWAESLSEKAGIEFGTNIERLREVKVSESSVLDKIYFRWTKTLAARIGQTLRIDIERTWDRKEEKKLHASPILIELRKEGQAARKGSSEPRASIFETATMTMSNLPRELFMKRIENFFRAVLESPSEREIDFHVIACGAPMLDRLLVVESDRVARFKPEFFEKEGDREREDQTFPAVVLSAQDRVASAVERNLDELQLMLTLQWPVTVRMSAIAVGIISALIIGFVAVPGDLRTLAIFALIGVGAGLIAPIMYDLYSILDRLRER